VIDAENFPGKLHFVLPPPIFPSDTARMAKEFAVRPNRMVADWAKAHKKNAERLFREAKYPERQFKLMAEAVDKAAGQKPLELMERTGAIRGFSIGPEDRHVIFVRVDLPARTKLGSVFEFDIQLRDSERARFAGGSRYRVVVNRPAR
jgi:hypothetical protein